MCSSAESSWLIQHAVSRSRSSCIRVITAKSSSPASSSSRQNLARVRVLRVVAAGGGGEGEGGERAMRHLASVKALPNRWMMCG